MASITQGETDAHQKESKASKFRHTLTFKPSSGVEASSKIALGNRNDIDAAFDDLEKRLMHHASHRKGDDTWSSTNEPGPDAMKVRIITLESKPAAGSSLQESKGMFRITGKQGPRGWPISEPPPTISVSTASIIKTISRSRKRRLSDRDGDRPSQRSSLSGQTSAGVTLSREDYEIENLANARVRKMKNAAPIVNQHTLNQHTAKESVP
ncbi:MAG: hypothetical protein OHK93_003324 [Ramalina farinacea]|uniref:Uncharacterized protein n=1 Tax=Ramalina farinacea TaxID=258253 RepID=A0AA43QTU2_9LECA|nr:hypothetical protein [Ramalina farinacea]